MAVIGFPVQTRAEEIIGRKVTEIAYRGVVRRVCGYTEGDAPPQYKVRVAWEHKDEVGNTVRTEVYLILQEDISLGVESFWKAFVNPYSGLSETVNVAFQAITGGRVTAFHKVATRRIWTGTTPLKLSLNLRLVAKNDAETEVVCPVKMLSSLALPREAAAGFVAPPGPSPYKIFEGFRGSGPLGRMAERVLRFYNERMIVSENIRIDVGMFLTFENVVVRNVDARFHSKFTPVGYPIAADVNIVFETYQILTRREFMKIFEAGKMEGGENKGIGVRPEAR